MSSLQSVVSGEKVRLANEMLKSKARCQDRLKFIYLYCAERAAHCASTPYTVTAARYSSKWHSRGTLVPKANMQHMDVFSIPPKRRYDPTEEHSGLLIEHGVESQLQCHQSAT